MIEVRNLTKHYGDKIAVNDISFTVEDGEILGFLGPNGAGKSTTMNMQPVTMPSMLQGSTMVRMMCHLPAPRPRAPSR